MASVYTSFARVHAITTRLYICEHCELLSPRFLRMSLTQFFK
jgi:hypothetical protein